MTPREAVQLSATAATGGYDVRGMIRLIANRAPGLIAVGGAPERHETVSRPKIPEAIRVQARYLRLVQKLPLEDVAAQLGIHYSSVSRLCRKGTP